MLAWSEGKSREFHSGMAAFLGGYLVFGKKTSVNEQVSTRLQSLNDNDLDFFIPWY